MAYHQNISKVLYKRYLLLLIFKATVFLLVFAVGVNVVLASNAKQFFVAVEKNFFEKTFQKVWLFTTFRRDNGCKRFIIFYIFKEEKYYIGT